MEIEKVKENPAWNVDPDCRKAVFDPRSNEM